MLKGVVIIGVVSLLVTVGVVGLLPLLERGSGRCCGPSLALKPALTGDGTVALSAVNAGRQGCCSPKLKADSPEAECCEKPTVEVIFNVEGLTCPAVNGLGCGHRIAPVLARLNKIDGVEKSYSNRTGTMLRVSVAPSADRDEVTAAVGVDLTMDNRKPVRLASDERKAALEKEEWNSPGDLSAIEFRTFALHRVKTFAEAEKLDKEVGGKLMKIAEQQWERMAKGGDCCGKVKQPGDWLAQFKQLAASVPDQAKELLSAEQTERLRQVLTKRLEEKDMAIAADTKQNE